VLRPCGQFIRAVCTSVYLLQSLLPDAHTIQTRSPPILNAKNQMLYHEEDHVPYSPQPAGEIPSTSSRESPPVNRLLDRLQETIKEILRNLCRDQIEDQSMSSMNGDETENVLMSETLP